PDDHTEGIRIDGGAILVEPRLAHRLHRRSDGELSVAVRALDLRPIDVIGRIEIPNFRREADRDFRRVEAGDRIDATPAREKGRPGALDVLANRRGHSGPGDNDSTTHAFRSGERRLSS